MLGFKSWLSRLVLGKVLLPVVLQFYLKNRAIGLPWYYEEDEIELIHTVHYSLASPRGSVPWLAMTPWDRRPIWPVRQFKQPVAEVTTCM